MSNTTLERPITDYYPSRIEDEPQLLDRHDPVVHGDMPGPLSTEQLQEYEANGFLSFRALFTPEELKPYIDELERLKISEAGSDSPRTITEPGSGDVRSIF